MLSCALKGRCCWPRCDRAESSFENCCHLLEICDCCAHSVRSDDSYCSLDSGATVLNVDFDTFEYQHQVDGRAITAESTEYQYYYYHTYGYGRIRAWGSSQGRVQGREMC